MMDKKMLVTKIEIIEAKIQDYNIKLERMRIMTNNHMENLGEYKKLLQEENKMLKAEIKHLKDYIGGEGNRAQASNLEESEGE